MYYKGSCKTKKSVMFKGRLDGTTFTGHPLSTTLGNTNRGLFSTKFAFVKAKARVTMGVSGDD